MPWWQIVLDVIGVLLLLAAVVFGGLIVRRRWLTRGEPTFDMSVRTDARQGSRGWTLGVGRYQGDRLEWFRVFSLSLRPKRVFDRRAMQLGDRRTPQGAEAYALFSGHLVVETCTFDQEVEVALSPDSFTGLLVWLESAPPDPSLGG
ncbi:DUF2550 domain-containing protein [soil metagenome]